MNEIGELLSRTREQTGVSLEEASTDLKIKTPILQNIEDGNIGCFKDIFVLKDYIYDYSKYLGLEPDRIIDEFNEYLFEYTSKIPTEDIEKAIQDKKKVDVVEEKKIVSPYTNSIDKKNSKLKVVIFVIVAILVALVVIWAIKAITIDNRTTNMIGYVTK